MYTRDWNAGRKTLSKNNQFHFVCPIFEARVSLRSCIQLRDQYWVYGKKIDKRKGCQACMASSKCPALSALHEILTQGGDPYYSENPEHTGVFSDKVYNRIARVHVIDSHIMKYDVDGPELLLINKANERARNGDDVKVTRRASNTASQKSTLEKLSDKATTSTVNAATAGDMSAAVNAMMEKRDD